MEIKYTAHLEFRLKIRNIPNNLPENIYNKAKEHYYDNSTRHYVAVHKTEFNGKIREIALSYDKIKDYIELITIHPLKKYQKQGRINSGRWEKYEKETIN